MVYLKRHLFFIVLYTSTACFGQECSNLRIVLTYIESSLEADMYYSEEFSKDEIRPPLIWVMDEKIAFNPDRFGVKANSSLKVEDKCVKTLEVSQIISRSNANYLLFASDIINNQLMIELVNNRAPYFNKPGGKTEYETWSRMNGGMSYLFTFNREGCIIEIDKKYVFND